MSAQRVFFYIRNMSATNSLQECI